MDNGFKVIFDQYGELLSAHECAAEVKYTIGGVTKPLPGCGPLCVFDNEKDARKFCIENLNEIYECEYKRYECAEVWNGRTQVHIEYLHKGTVLADEVVLTRKMQRGAKWTMALR